MFEAKHLLFLYVETPLHAGSGRGAGAVDLPVQRERTTGYPMVQSSGMKGCLRSVYRETKKLSDDDPAVTALFGKAGAQGENFAGAVSPGDVRLLLFPIRSLAGVFAWGTSAHALANFKRTAELAGEKISWTVPGNPAPDQVLVSNPTDLKAGSDVVLEEFSFTPRESAEVVDIAGWLGTNALPPGYDYWVNALQRRLCILPEDAFRDFCLYATEVQTHIRLDPKTKTVANKMLWTSESLPVDTLLYTPLLATGVRDGKDQRKASDVLSELSSLNLTRFQLGGDETTGQGWVGVRFYPEVKS